jgi:hypothetical protein
VAQVKLLEGEKVGGARHKAHMKLARPKETGTNADLVEGSEPGPRRRGSFGIIGADVRGDKAR